MPAILEFPGYKPLPVASSLPGGFAAVCLALDLSRRKMIAKLGVNPTTLLDWETGRHQPTGKSLGPIGMVLQISWRRE
jgi:transcriptional regulator with XRE-family HTH domain